MATQSSRLLACAALTLSAPALAELPEPVRAMVQAAIDNGDPAKVDAVVEIAKQTNPGEVAEIDALHAGFKQQQQRLAAEAEQAKLRKIREASLFERWKGKGELGGYHSSGNSSELGITAALALERVGIDWTHKLRARADVRRANGTTTQEQYMLAYEPRYQVSGRLFAYGLGQYESDRFQGFSSRYSLSGGLGYKLIDDQDLKLAVKAGPAFRRTDFVNGGGTSNIGALVALDFDWAITDRLRLTQDTNVTAEAGGQATAFIDANNTSLNLVTGLEAKVSTALTTRLSYAVEYDSNPPAGAVSTDTLTRFTLIYGF